MKKCAYFKNGFNILASLWISYVFLGSLPYKFTNHPDTQNIFGTIGEWIGSGLGETIGNGFVNYGAYVVGTFELIASIVLLTGVLGIITKAVGLKDKSKNCDFLFVIGGKIAAMLMAGAVFFHLVSPLGIEVMSNGEPDGGSLFMAAVSVLILGALLVFINLDKFCKKFPNWPFCEKINKMCDKCNNKK